MTMMIAALLFAAARNCVAPAISASPARIAWRADDVHTTRVDDGFVYVETLSTLRKVNAASGATIWTYRFTADSVSPEFVVLPDRIAIVRDDHFIAFLDRGTGELLSKADAGEWIRFLAGPPLLVVTQGVDAPVSTVIRMTSDGTVLSSSIAPRVRDLLIVDHVAVLESDGESADDQDLMSGYDLDTLQRLWSEKSHTFNKQVIGDRLYLGDIFWSKGAKALDPRTGTTKVFVPVRDPFAIGGSEDFDLQVVDSAWVGNWDPYRGTCNGLRRNDARTAKTMWRTDLPFHVSGTLRDGATLYVAGTRDAEHRYLVAMDWKSGKVERAWSGVPYMSDLKRVGNLIVGFELVFGNLAAVRIDD